MGLFSNVKIRRLTRSVLISVYSKVAIKKFKETEDNEIVKKSI